MTQNQKSESDSRRQARKQRRRRPTINQVFHPAVALAQRLPHLGPVCRLGLIFGFKGGLAVLRRLQGRLVALLLVGQAVTLLSQGGALGLLGTKGGLGSAQLAPQVCIGPCNIKKEVIRKRSDPTTR